MAEKGNSASTELAKGSMKEAIGKLTGDTQVEAEGRGPTIEKLEANVDKVNQRIETMKVQMEDKEGNKEVALGTSKIVSEVLLWEDIASS